MLARQQVDDLHDALDPRTRAAFQGWQQEAALRIVSHLFVLVFAIVFLYWGTRFVRFGWDQTSELAELPMPWIFAAWPLAGLAATVRSHAEPVTPPDGPFIDTCGTGGDRAGTFNVSTAAAIVCAGAGVKVAKHGNRAASSRSPPAATRSTRPASKPSARWAFPGPAAARACATRGAKGRGCCSKAAPPPRVPRGH